MAVLAPMQRPSVASTISVNAGLFRNCRQANRTSFQSGISLILRTLKKVTSGKSPNRRTGNLSFDGRGPIIGRRILMRILAICLFAAVCYAQEPAPAPALSLTILEGDGAINNIRQRTARAP